MLKSILLVGVGGFVGSSARYLLSYYLNNGKYIILPLGTLLANLIGSFLFGYFMATLMKSDSENSVWNLLLVTGFCGGFTTFSTFSYENFNYLQQSEYLLFFGYTSISIVIALALITFGFWLGKVV